MNYTTPFSPKHGKVLSLYEGLKDEYAPMKEIFGPIFSEFHQLQQNVKKLQLPSPSAGDQACTTTYNMDCQSCLDIIINNPDKIAVGTVPIQDVKQMFISYGGDYEGIMQLLGVYIYIFLGSGHSRYLVIYWAPPHNIYRKKLI